MEASLIARFGEVAEKNGVSVSRALYSLVAFVTFREEEVIPALEEILLHRFAAQVVRRVSDMGEMTSATEVEEELKRRSAQMEREPPVASDAPLAQEVEAPAGAPEEEGGEDASAAEDGGEGVSTDVDAARQGDKREDADVSSPAGMSVKALVSHFEEQAVANSDGQQSDTARPKATAGTTSRSNGKHRKKGRK